MSIARVASVNVQFPTGSDSMAVGSVVRGNDGPFEVHP
jgi:hypothetical protein